MRGREGNCDHLLDPHDGKSLLKLVMPNITDGLDQNETTFCVHTYSALCPHIKIHVDQLQNVYLQIKLLFLIPYFMGE